MTKEISALDLTPEDTVRRLGPEAIAYYVTGLKGIYLPDHIREEYERRRERKIHWDPNYRLRGKFARFALRVPESESSEDIIVVGSTIGVRGLDQYDELFELRHYHLGGSLDRFIDDSRYDKLLKIDGVDYGHTQIQLDDNGVATSLTLGRGSLDYGRARPVERIRTCEIAQALVGSDITIINADNVKP